jgi:hypothetical protein
MKKSYQQILKEFDIGDLKVAFDPKRKAFSELVTTRLVDITADGVMVFNSTAVTTPGIPYWTQHIHLVDWYDSIGMVDLNFSERAYMAVFGDILVRCNDPSFLYFGYSYILTQLDTNLESKPDYDKNMGPEDRYPIIRNPDLEGVVCKHLIRVLEQLPYMVSSVAKAMKTYVETGAIEVDLEVVPEEETDVTFEPETISDETPDEDRGHTKGHFTMEK